VSVQQQDASHTEPPPIRMTCRSSRHLNQAPREYASQNAVCMIEQSMVWPAELDNRSINGVSYKWKNDLLSKL